MARPVLSIQAAAFYYSPPSQAVQDLRSIAGSVVCATTGQCTRSAIGVRLDQLRTRVNQVCAWTRFIDQTGRDTWYGLNFAGQALVDARRAPGTTSWFATINRYNLHGELAWTRSPTGRLLELSYAEESPSPLSRGNLVRVKETAAGTPAMVRSWALAHEPLFNRVIRQENELDHRVSTFTYDYQEREAVGGAAMVVDYLATFGSTAVALHELAPWLTFAGGDRNDDGRTDRVYGDLIVEREPQAITAAGVAQDLVRTHVYNELGQLIQSRESGGRQVDLDYYAAVHPSGQN